MQYQSWGATYGPLTAAGKLDAGGAFAFFVQHGAAANDLQFELQATVVRLAG